MFSNSVWEGEAFQTNPGEWKVLANKSAKTVGCEIFLTWIIRKNSKMLPLCNA